jgi:hypothetical protein
VRLAPRLVRLAPPALTLPGSTSCAATAAATPLTPQIFDAPLDGTFVGRRGKALWCDPDDDEAEPEWYSMTLVTHRPGGRVKYNFVMHFDDGTREKIALPDADGTVVLGDEVVERCACERCACAEPLGRALPLPDEQIR